MHETHMDREKERDGGIHTYIYRRENGNIHRMKHIETQGYQEKRDIQRKKSRQTETERNTGEEIEMNGETGSERGRHRGRDRERHTQE